ncbi:MAG: type II 3-dehydroquinate dehydratase [Nocardioidaceae bacterium]
MPVLVLNGPNLDRLGTREPSTYGSMSYAELVELCVGAGTVLGIDVEVRQTNAEGELIEWLHEAADAGSAVVLNPAAWSHTSLALRDACAMLTGPLVEVHISNIHAREEFRHHSYVSGVADAVLAGFGVHGYVAALTWLAEVRLA